MEVEYSTVLYGKISETLQAVPLGTNSNYVHAHMPKINSSYVKICECSRPLLARISPASRPEILNCYPHRSIGMSANSIRSVILNNTLAGAWAGGTEYGVNFVLINKFVCFVFCVTSFPLLARGLEEQGTE